MEIAYSPLFGHVSLRSFVDEEALQYVGSWAGRQYNGGILATHDGFFIDVYYES